MGEERENACAVIGLEFRWLGQRFHELHCLGGDVEVVECRDS